jgi:hypothetical protein
VAVYLTVRMAFPNLDTMTVARTSRLKIQVLVQRAARR